MKQNWLNGYHVMKVKHVVLIPGERFLLVIFAVGVSSFDRFELSRHSISF